MLFSKTAEKEMRELSHSSSLKKDMDAVACSRHNPFVKAGRVDVDAYIAFVADFNEFINHEPKPFMPIKDFDMRL
jgi:hypothetical protein